jgi:hypothetical protein
MSIDEYLRSNTWLDRERLMAAVRREQREEDDMVARARGTSLLDGMLEFDLFLDKHRQWSRWPEVRRLTRDEVFAGHDLETVRQARVKAQALLGAAERYGDKAHDRVDPVELREEMRRDHPGFSETSYDAVLMWGMFLMR